MAQQVTQLVTLNTEECCNCGIIFAMPATMQTRLRTNGRSFYCPNGHAQHYAKTEVNRLQEKLDEQIRVATQMAEHARNAENAEQRTAKELKRIKKRVTAGVCPCCNRKLSSS